MYLASSVHDSRAQWKVVGLNVLTSSVATVLFKLAAYELLQEPSFTYLLKHLLFSYGDRSAALIARPARLLITCSSQSTWVANSTTILE